MIDKMNPLEEYLNIDVDGELDLRPAGGDDEKIEDLEEYEKFDLRVNRYRLYKKEPPKAE